MNQPRLIIIGAQKAGTSWLASQLFQHPRLHNPGMKEIHFFNKLKHGKVKASQKYKKRIKRKCKFFSKTELASLVNKKHSDLEDYFYLFSKAKRDQICWEATPNYSTMNREKLTKMKDALPNAKYIFIVRDPIERAKSSLRMWLSRRENRFSEEQIISQWSKKRINGYKYSESVATLDRTFDKSSILYIPFGLIKTSPHKVLSEVERFAGINPYDQYKNPSQQVHITKKISLSESASRLINDNFIGDMNYINDRFGTTFAEQTR